MPSPKKRGLGRGLEALISSASSDTETEGARPRKVPRLARVDASGKPTFEALADGSILIELDPHEIGQNPRQPRQRFDEEALQELAQSIRQDGVLEPVIVRQKDGVYELVSGERRVKASILADRDRIPAVVRVVDDREMLKIGLIENIQREDLNPIETAQAYGHLIEDFGWTQDELAQHVGKNRSTVTNTLRLLNLEPDVQTAVLEGKISMGHAKALLAIEVPSRQSAACRKIIMEGYSVRQAEKLAAPAKPRGPAANGTVSAKDPHLVQIEDRLRRRYGAKVTLTANDKNRGKIEIEFYGLEDLDRLLSQLEP